jgi:hypothetical protein
MSVRFRLVLAAGLLAAAPGCATWKIDKHDVFPWCKEEPQVPTKVVAMWSSTVLNQGDRPSTRGFGGRLMFYGAKDEKAVMVEGSLIVYGFDETHGKKEAPRPDRKFVFTREQFAKHYSKSSLGHSYSVWVPWDDAMGAPCKVSLIVRFVPKQGTVVLGEQTTLMLQGPGDSEAGAKTNAANPTVPAGAAGLPNLVRQVSHEAEIPRPLAGIATGEGFAGQVRTTTIPIPMQSRLARGGSQTSMPSAVPAGAAAVGQAPAATAATPQAPAAVPQPQQPQRPATSALPRSGRYTIPRARPLGDPIPLPRADRAGWPLPVAAARGTAEPATTASPPAP